MILAIVLSWATRGAPALALTKAMAERNGHVLVIDLGSRPDEVDRSDELIALDRPCGSDVDRGRILADARAAAQEVDRTSAVTTRIIAAYGLPDLHLTSVVSDAFLGGALRPLILIYPEVHLDGDRGEGNLRVHVRGTREAVGLVEAVRPTARPILNAIEYPFGPIGRGPEVASPDPAAAVERLVRHDQLSFGFALNEIFGDQVRTVAVDDHELWLKNQATSLAWSLRDEAPLRRQENSAQILKARLREWDSDRYELDPALAHFFDMVLGKTPAALKRLNSDVCEERSRFMADHTVEAATSDTIGFLQIGASHVYGVRKRFRELGVSYLVLSP